MNRELDDYRKREMKRPTEPWVLAFLIIGLSHPGDVVGADEVDELIDALKPSPVDHPVWAEALLKAADDIKDSPAAQGRVYEKAYELGGKTARGYAAAIMAAQAAIKVQPDRKVDWQQKLLAARRLDWQAAGRQRKVEATGYVIANADKSGTGRTYDVVVRVAAAAKGGDDVEVARFSGTSAGAKVALSEQAGGWQGVIDKGRLRAANPAGGKIDLAFTVRKSPVELQNPPSGAVVLLPYRSGQPPSLRYWANKKWVPLRDGSVVVSGGDTRLLRSVGSFRMHLEFLCPLMPSSKGQQRAKGGVLLPDASELQVLDSFGLKRSDVDCGAIYKVAAPKVAMSLPPDCWQTYDIVYHAAKGTRPATITVQHNGVLIHKDLVLPTPKSTKNKRFGRISLQGYSGKVRYRNIWLIEMKD